jgi:hypothetical protein
MIDDTSSPLNVPEMVTPMTLYTIYRNGDGVSDLDFRGASGGKNGHRRAKGQPP